MVSYQQEEQREGTARDPHQPRRAPHPARVAEEPPATGRGQAQDRRAQGPHPPPDRGRRARRQGRADGAQANTLYGALLALKAGTSDPATLERWRKAGGQAFDREAKARDEGKEPLVFTLRGPQPASITTALRSLGFRWSKVMGHWKGIAHHDQALALASELGGSLRRLAPPATEDVSTAAA